MAFDCSFNRPIKILIILVISLGRKAGLVGYYLAVFGLVEGGFLIRVLKKDRCRFDDFPHCDSFQHQFFTEGLLNMWIHRKPLFVVKG